jgi:hypothetical protein
MGTIIEMCIGHNEGRHQSLNELKEFCEDQIEEINFKHPESDTAILRVLQMKIVIAKIDEMYKE